MNAADNDTTDPGVSAPPPRFNSNVDVGSASQLMSSIRYVLLL